MPPASCGSVDPVNTIRSARGGYASQFCHPSRADTEAAARVLPGCAAVRLHRAIGPAPLALCTEVHVGLDLYPIRGSGENRRRSQVYRERRAHYRDWLVQSAVDLRAGKTPAVGVNEDIPIEGRSCAVEVHPVGIDRLHIPSLTSGHDKVVGQIGAKGREVVERRAQRGISPGIIVLVI